jgi:hypothetical protein
LEAGKSSKEPSVVQKCIKYDYQISKAKLIDTLDFLTECFWSFTHKPKGRGSETRFPRFIHYHPHLEFLLFQFSSPTLMLATSFGGWNAKSEELKFELQSSSAQTRYQHSSNATSTSSYRATALCNSTAPPSTSNLTHPVSIQCKATPLQLDLE